jgi:hypothetical protein
MNIIKKISILLLAAAALLSCAEKEEPVVYLDVNAHNISGYWKLVQWNGTTLDESTFYYAIQWIGYGWTAVCMLIAIREVHQYSLMKTVVTLAVTFAGLVIVVVVAAIVYSVFGQLISFLSTVWSELTLHL